MNSNSLVGAAIGAAAVGFGLLLGWLIFGNSSGPSASEPAGASGNVDASVENSGRTGTGNGAMGVAEQAYAEGDLAAAYEALLPLAESGDATAMWRIGLMHADGLHVEADAEQAIDWLSRAHDGGEAAAGPRLGELLRERALGEGDRSPAAVSDLSRAAELGNLEAQSVMGSFLMAGVNGVTQDYAQAYEYLSSASAQGDARAQVNLAYLYARGYGVEQDDVQARYWYGVAARAGLVRAQTAYALFLERGRGGEEDFAQAMQFYLNAADAGARPAMIRLGQLILDERMVAESPQAAAVFVAQAVRSGESAGLHWLEEAAAQGSGAAAFRLAELLIDGEGAPQNIEAAVDLLQHAAELGEPGAQLALANRYAAGDGVDLDYVQAHKWANLSAASGLERAVDVRDSMAQLMTADQLAEAQELATQWRNNNDG